VRVSFAPPHARPSPARLPVRKGPAWLHGGAAPRAGLLPMTYIVEHPSVFSFLTENVTLTMPSRFGVNTPPLLGVPTAPAMSRVLAGVVSVFSGLPVGENISG
jgi:hypothetical protein